MDGHELRRLRARAGLTQATTAAKLGVSPNSVARWERDEVRITEAMAKLIRLTLAAPNKGKGKGD